MSEIRAIVVDDEPLARDELIFLLDQCEGLKVVAQARGANEALTLCDEHAVDVAFVDLRMPGPDGIALAQAITERYPEVAVVVVSAHDDGAIRAFEARVVDYLLKPVRLERLQSAIERVAARPAKRSSASKDLSRLAVKRRGGFVIVDLEDVIYFEVRDELVWAVTAKDRFALDLSLAAIEQRVPEGRYFRSHRGSLVRLSHISAIEPAGNGTFELLLDHPDLPRVPLARERARALRELIPVAG